MQPWQRTGYGPNRFETTRWTLIFDVRSDDPVRNRPALEVLLKRYWSPIYWYLRRRGYDNESAKDLTQGFMAEIMLGRSLVHDADETKGRFRGFLIGALKCYVQNVRRAQRAKKRQPSQGMVELDGLDAAPPDTGSDADPEQAFTYAWASSLLDQALSELADAYAREGKAAYWDCFQARVLGPIMDGDPPVPLPELCARHGIDGEAAISNMLITVKRRFRTVLRRHVRQLVESDDQVDQEINDLMQILAAGRAR